MKDFPAADGLPQSALLLVLRPVVEPSTERLGKRIDKLTVLMKKRKKNEENTSMENNPEDSAMRRAHAAVGVVGIVFSIVAVSFFGLFTGAGVAVGATIGSVNLFILSRSVHNMVEGQRASWAGAAVLKFIVLLAVIYGLINAELLAPLALAMGFGALPVGILLAGTTGVSHDHSSLPPGPSIPSQQR